MKSHRTIGTSLGGRSQQLRLQKEQSYKKLIPVNDTSLFAPAINIKFFQLTMRATSYKRSVNEHQELLRKAKLRANGE